jgi:hypothetical protein
MEAQAQGKAQVTLLIASKPGANDAVVAEVSKLRGVVEYRDDDVSYLRVKVPTNDVEKLSYRNDIEALNINGIIDYLTYAGQEKLPITRRRKQLPAPDQNTPPENPYLPSREIGAPQFIGQHPSFDGRGVTIAIVDSSIDLLLPELQTAKALDGRATRKLADVLTAVPSAVVSSDDDSSIAGYFKVNMQQKVAAVDGRFTYQGFVHIAPADGTYHVGTFDERINGGSGDLNRDGNPTGSSGIFSVLWEENTNTVWVDTNQDYNFADEKRMTDYYVRHDVGTFGKDDPKTLVRETVGFTVQTDARHELILVVPGYAFHGTGVAGVAAGKRFFDGKVNGVAPEAQIVSVPLGRGATNVTPSCIESVIVATKNPKVDLVSIQFGNFLPQNDGQSTFSLILDRLIDKYQKLIFAGAGNGTDWLNNVLSPADANKVIAVGSYINKHTSQVNYGVDIAGEDNVNAFSSHGPSKQGGFKPNILAPTTSLTTRPGFLPGENRQGTYPLPPGYQISGGTSTSSPMATGGAALLISAAKQSGVRHDADRLRWAIMSTARFLPGSSAEAQGAGLMQVGAAWEALKAAPNPVNIVSRAPVKAVLSEYLKDPDYGLGIYEREGWTAGQSGLRMITFTRTSGDSKPITYSLRWIGNDGTYLTAREITLPLRVPVELGISINPRTMGVHCAILNLDSPKAPAVYQIMNTVVAAEQLTAANGFSASREGKADWLKSQSYFINVPVGTPAMRVDVRITQGNVMPSLTRPNGRFYYSIAFDRRPVEFTHYQKAGSWSRVISHPDPGVWQVTIDNSDISGNPLPDSRHDRALFTITATLMGVEIRPPELAVGLPSKGSIHVEKVSLRNKLGSFTGGLTSAPLSSVFAAAPTLYWRSAPVQYSIVIPPGSARVGARISAAPSSLADLDLYLFDCTGKECVLKDFGTGPGSDEQVEVEAPSAGFWKVLIDPFSIPRNEIGCVYRDYFMHHAFGSITVEEGLASYENGVTATQNVAVQVSASPIGTRYLAGILYAVGLAGNNRDREFKGSSPSRLAYPTQAILGTAEVDIKGHGAYR